MRELPPEAKERIGDGIRIAMTRAQMSQSELADALGQTRSLVSKWISGTHAPSVYWLLRIAHATGQKDLTILLANPTAWRKWFGKSTRRDTNRPVRDPR